MQYKLFKDREGNVCSVLLFDNDKVTGIPLDPANTDYQKFLAWVAEGNTPTPADE